jgi:hypothetical protein
MTPKGQLASDVFDMALDMAQKSEEADSDLFWHPTNTEANGRAMSVTVVLSLLCFD